MKSPDFQLTDQLRAVIADHPDTQLQLRPYTLSSMNTTYEATATQQLTSTTRAQLILAGFDLTWFSDITLSVYRKLVDQRFTVVMTEVSMHLKRDLSVYVDWTPDEPLANRVYNLRQNWLYASITTDQATAMAPLLTPQATALAQLVNTFIDTVTAAKYNSIAMTMLHDHLQQRSECVQCNWMVSS
jgi:hypothetical protein